MALTIPLRTVDGGSAGSIDLDESVFGIEPNVAVMHQVVTAQLAAARSGTQSTKTRAEVPAAARSRSSRRAQAGPARVRPGLPTGSAAAWPSGRSPVQLPSADPAEDGPAGPALGPLRSGASEQVAVIDEWPWTQPKTADAKAALAALGLDGKVLIVLDREKDDDAYKFLPQPARTCSSC